MQQFGDLVTAILCRATVLTTYITILRWECLTI